MKRWSGFTRYATSGSLILLSSLVLLAALHATVDSDSTLWPAKSWTQSTPARVGLDQKVLDAFSTEIETGERGLVDSFTVFRCGRQVYSKKYAHDYGRIYAKGSKEKGPLNARLTGRYNYF